MLTESFVYCYYTDNPLIWNYFFVNLFGLKNLPLTLSTHFDEKKSEIFPSAKKKSKSTCYYVNTIMSFFSPILINDWSLYFLQVISRTTRKPLLSLKLAEFYIISLINSLTCHMMLFVYIQLLWWGQISYLVQAKS